MTKKSCFVICPLGDADSATRQRADALFAQVIRPVVEPLGYTLARADRVHDKLTIPDSISAHIFSDDLVIADLTDCNPNVFYELGKRHAWGWNCVHLTRDVSRLPFDVRHHRVIQYDLNDPPGLDSVRKALRLSIEALEATPLQCPYPLTPQQVVELEGVL